jgi:hypothetical protein
VHVKQCSSGGCSGGTGGAGGGYGGGGGDSTSSGRPCGSSDSCSDYSGNPGGNGAPGIIVITYAAPLAVSISVQSNVCIDTPGAFVIRRNGPPTFSAITVPVSYSGTAVVGLDYAALPTSVTIPANTMSVTIPVAVKEKSTGQPTTLIATLGASSDYNLGVGAVSMSIQNINAPIVETVAGYTSAPFTAYVFTPFSDNPGGLPSYVMNAWYTGQPDPALQNAFGSTPVLGAGLSYKFDALYGARLGMITASPQDGQDPVSSGVDLTYKKGGTNACGTQLLHWAYVPQQNTLWVPKYTPVQTSYACQPYQVSFYRTDTSCFLGFGSCNITDHSYIFRLADRARFNGGAESTTLHGAGAAQTVSANQSFTLQCGGFRPEDGTSASGFVPPLYDSGETERSGDWFSDSPDTYIFTNAKAATYYHPMITLNVNACSNDNEIVVNNVCTPCPAGTYRTGNSCTSNVPPSATINAGGGLAANGHDGKAASFSIGEPITITATYAADTATASQTKALTTSQTWTVPTGLSSSAIQVEAWGGGGGGGGDGSGATGGTGGVTTFNTTMSAGGGTGGQKDNWGGGVGGTASGGNTTNTKGNNGDPGATSASGKGGDAPGGGGAGGASINTDSNGNPGNAPGGGGSGGCNGSKCANNNGGGGGGSGAYVKNIYAAGALAAGAQIPVVIGAGGAGGGGSNQGGAGGAGKVVISYTAADSLAATAINDDATNVTVDCSKVVGDVSGSGNSNCWTTPDTQKTYTFTPSGPGLWSFSAQIKTAAYATYNGYASVKVRVCPAGLAPDGNGGCNTVDQCLNNAVFPGTQLTVPDGCTQNPDYTCSLPSGYIFNGTACVPGTALHCSRP